MSYIQLDPAKLGQEMAVRGLNGAKVAAETELSAHTVGRALRGEQVRWETAVTICRYVRSVKPDPMVSELVLAPAPVP